VVLGLSVFWFQTDPGGAPSLEKQLICPICVELFTKPVVILPCQHNLCRSCANLLYQVHLPTIGRFRCPSCRHEVVLDRHGVYGLQRNLLVENIIDVYKQEVSNMTCSDHEGEKVNIYCLTCRRPTCSLCKVFGSHQSCTVAPLTHVYEQQKVYAMQKQLVSQKFDRLFSIVDERRKAMMERITSEQEEKTGHAQALVRCYGDTAEANRKLMERASSSMEDPDTAAFVQNSRELISKVTAAASSCPTETLTPGFENMNHYTFTFSQQEEVLQNIDFPRGKDLCRVNECYCDKSVVLVLLSGQ
uniref:Tripartite motif containing 101 n=1 Tax=Sphaeramia orbicularis TaxID=375764 RepID=A0A673ARM6_9TELE